MARIDWTMAVPLASPGVLPMKLRSIFSSHNGSRFR
jgi:hypothetical protein